MNLGLHAAEPISVHSRESGNPGPRIRPKNWVPLPRGRAESGGDSNPSHLALVAVARAATEKTGLKLWRVALSRHPFVLAHILAPTLERGPQAAVEPEAVDRRGGGDCADAQQHHAAPLEAALFKHSARGPVRHPPARLPPLHAHVPQP